MRVAHWSLFAPHCSGMYETTKDLVLAERDLGIEAELIDMHQPAAVQRDGDFFTGTTRFADIADVYVLHSRVDQPWFGDGTPIVFLAHGAPYYTWQTELYGLEEGNPAPWSTSLGYLQDPRITRVVTFWADQLPYWSLLNGPGRDNRVSYVSRGVQLMPRYTPDGDSDDLAGRPVLMIADSFRLCKDMLPVLFAAGIFHRDTPDARLHIFGVPNPGNHIGDTIRRVIQQSELRHLVTTVAGVHHEIERAYRAADIVLSAVRGESRVVIEAKACGCDVITQSCVGTDEADFREPKAIADCIARVWWRRQAAREQCRQNLHAQTSEQYDIRRTALGLATIYEEVKREHEERLGYGAQYGQ